MVLASEKVAKMIAAAVGADLFKIEQKVPYAADYNTCIEQAKNDLRAKARPERYPCRKVWIAMMKFIWATLNCSPVLSVYYVYRVPIRAGKGTVYTDSCKKCV